ncbi:hypothetical protein O181_005544 [Austropuccinia psidii MF-1]|uniref:Uncharacterized protein n=1 Tax=Austropuccinia psidii MF-1 TaxID=1389203 RepID=A0A9Q3BIB5_9BASI|nr:hypothetical protein [Austropuccinia psidii MF-1]
MLGSKFTSKTSKQRKTFIRRQRLSTSQARETFLQRQINYLMPNKYSSRAGSWIAAYNSTTFMIGAAFVRNFFFEYEGRTDLFHKGLGGKAKRKKLPQKNHARNKTFSNMTKAPKLSKMRITFPKRQKIKTFVKKQLDHLNLTQLDSIHGRFTVFNPTLTRMAGMALIEKKGQMYVFEYEGNVNSFDRALGGKAKRPGANINKLKRPYLQMS